MKKQPLLTNADQLIELIRLIGILPKLGTETTRIKMGFKEYFQAFVSKHISSPLLREKLRQIPVMIQPAVDVEGNKKLTFEIYRSAVLNFILNELIQEQHQLFFNSEKLAEAEALLQRTIKELRNKQEDEVDVEAYIRAIEAQNHEMELMVVLALSLSLREMENKIGILERDHAILWGELFEAFHKDLGSEEMFNNLKDIHGNAVIVNETERKEIINSILQNYTDNFAEFCTINNAVPINNPPHMQAQAAQPRNVNRLHAFNNQNNELFERYHQENQNRFQQQLSSRLRERNIHVDHSAPQVEFLGQRMHTRAIEERRRITKAASMQMELSNSRSDKANMEQSLVERGVVRKAYARQRLEGL